MAKIPRKEQKIFGKNANTDDLIEFGSIAGGLAVPATDLDDIQTAAFETGWRAGIVAGAKRLPTLNDDNSINYVFSNQIAYLLQEGVAEYNATTEYFENSIVKKVGTYELYGSKTDNNTGNLLSDAANWEFLGDLSDLSNLNPLPTGYINGLIPENDTTDPNNDIVINTGKCRDDSDTVDIVLATAITKQLDAVFAEGTNQGGLNTGSKANDTWYDLYIIAKADGTTDVMFSTFANRETLPSGFVYKRYIGAIRTDASGNIRQGLWTPKAGGGLEFSYLNNVQDFVSTSVGSTFASVSVTVPPNRYGNLLMKLYNSSSADYFLRNLLNNSENRLSVLRTGTTYDANFIAKIFVNESSQFQHRFSTGTGAVVIDTLGYIDERVE